MNPAHSLEEAARYARLALPLMSKLGIPMTPRNYTVWYEYISGKNSELREFMDSMMKNTGRFSEEQNDMLYRRFFEEKDKNESLELLETLRHIIVSIVVELAQLTGQTEKYDSLVSMSVDRLSQETSTHRIKEIVNQIIMETKEIRKSVEGMQQGLRRSSEELGVLQKQIEQAKTEATTDFLTGLANRRAFDEMLVSFVNETKAGKSSLSLLLIDIDDFKVFNDKYGHLVGDEVLKFVAKTLQKMVRGRDLIARYGGEEFAIILPEAPLNGARKVGEQIRCTLSEGRLKKVSTSEDLGTVTVSIGVASYQPCESSEDLIRRSDQALYSAKKNGKNCVVIEKAEEH